MSETGKISNAGWTTNNFVPSRQTVYRCAAGHELKLLGDYVPLRCINPAGEMSDYHFCFQCWGIWAEKQWPLRKVEGETS